MQPQECSVSKTNNFDLLRLLFAGAVLLVHAKELSGFSELAWITQVLSSAVAVKAFFIVSGFLVFMSYERSATLRAYAEKRFRRIYPAYFAVIALSAIFLICASTGSPEAYFSSEWLKYLLANLTFLNFIQPTLPGVFEQNRMPAVNGALWTLKIEVLFYCVVPLFVWAFRKFGTLLVLVIGYLSSIAYGAFFTGLAESTELNIYAEIARQLPGQLAYFLSGAVLYYFMPAFKCRHKWLLVAAVLTLCVGSVAPIRLLEPIALATIVIFCALFLPASNASKYGDFSYGIYILHFPVIQLLLQFNAFRDNPYYFLPFAILLTGLGAAASWHFLEKRFLTLKPEILLTKPGNAAYVHH